MGNGNGEHIYGIKGGTAFDLEHIMALKLYTDFDQLCGLFCDQFRLKTIIDDILESVESLRARNECFYHLAKLLTECVQCFGAIIYGDINYKQIKRRKSAKWSTNENGNEDEDEDMVGDMSDVSDDQDFGLKNDVFIKRSKQRHFFRGIKGEYMFRRFVTRYHCPMSTTWDVCCYFVVGLVSELHLFEISINVEKP